MFCVRNDSSELSLARAIVRSRSSTRRCCACSPCKPVQENNSPASRIFWMRRNGWFMVITFLYKSCQCYKQEAWLCQVMNTIVPGYMKQLCQTMETVVPGYMKQPCQTMGTVVPGYTKQPCQAMGTVVPGYTDRSVRPEAPPYGGK